MIKKVKDPVKDEPKVSENGMKNKENQEKEGQLKSNRGNKN